MFLLIVEAIPTDTEVNQGTMRRVSKTIPRSMVTSQLENEEERQCMEVVVKATADKIAAGLPRMTYL